MEDLSAGNPGMGSGVYPAETGEATSAGNFHLKMRKSGPAQRSKQSKQG